MLENIVWFVLGMIVSSLFSYVASIGWSVILLKQTQKSCAALFTVSEQGLQEILHLKYIVLEESGRSQQNITAQKYIDQMTIASVKTAIMKNYVSTFPESYKNVMEYSSWEELEEYVNEAIKNKDKIE